MRGSGALWTTVQGRVLCWFDRCPRGHVEGGSEEMSQICFCDGGPMQDGVNIKERDYQEANVVGSEVKNNKKSGGII